MNTETSRPDRSNRLIDLRSDTVTRPTPGMRDAMAKADVGDDVYGEDPTVRALEERAADMLGKQAGVLVASGTQSNLTALLTHCGRGDEYIGGVGYHVARYEAGGAAVLGGISPRHVLPDDRGGLSASDVQAAIQPDDEHFAVTKLVCLENTHNGLVQDQAGIEQIAEVAKANGLSLHIDGARLMNAAVACGRPAADLAAPMDSVSLCLSKGLGAPVGSVLCGSNSFIRRARRNRKILGGGMRQAGVLAACGLYALANNVERLAEDHANARALAQRLAGIDGISVDLDKVHTNMVYVNFTANAKEPLAEHMKARGILVASAKPALRLVTHLDFEASDIDKVVDGFASWLA